MDSGEVLEGAIVRDLLITNKRGLHARASAKFVQLVEGYDAEVAVSKDSQTVGGTSIMGLMMLAASPGTTIRVAARGRQANEVLDAITTLVEAKFYEE
ncbi:HPr family phosphocarrier protein [Prosthecomicrobium sp. N25]|uniref:HPr family phosphocarrier protein n=1 Tax=Prosthecomicrobium sp. N25 TaxID=3129254 RepID=UPI003076FD2C